MGDGELWREISTEREAEESGRAAGAERERVKHKINSERAERWRDGERHKQSK